MISTLLSQLDGPDGDRTPRLAYGADYNPEQWPREVWEEDVRLMQEAGVNLVSVGIFSWARIQPAQDEWDFGWLDEIMDLLHAGGIGVDLATATASPPPWLTTAHPEILPVTASGETVWPGARQHWRPTSPVFRTHALRLVRELAERYAGHPALVAWHVNNELGCHNVYDHSDDAARAFRVWLRARYTTLDGLNHAWGTAFWSQRYSDWEQILPPRLAASHPNPTQQLDFKRFSSDALKDHLRAERDVLREITPNTPVTTNFMVMGGTKGMDYADWADEIDFVSNDHYVTPGPRGRDELSFSASLTSAVAGLRAGDDVVVVGDEVDLGGPVGVVHALGLAHDHEVGGDRGVRGQLAQDVPFGPEVVLEGVGGEPLEVQLLGGVGVGGVQPGRQDLGPVAVVLGPERGGPRVVERVQGRVPGA